MQNEIEAVEKEMKSQSSGEAIYQLSDGMSNQLEPSSSRVNEAGRIASDEHTHIILISSQPMPKSRQRDPEPAKIERIIGHRLEISNRANVVDGGINFDDVLGGQDDDDGVREEQKDVFGKEPVSSQMSEESAESDEEISLATPSSSMDFKLTSKPENVDATIQTKLVVEEKKSVVDVMPIVVKTVADKNVLLPHDFISASGSANPNGCNVTVGSSAIEDRAVENIEVTDKLVLDVTDNAIGHSTEPGDAVSGSSDGEILYFPCLKPFI